MLPSVDATYVLARAALFPPLHLGIRWTIEGSQMVPVRGPVILASNHISYLDPLVLAYLADRRHRKVRFLAKAELFDKGLLGPLLRSAGQIPVRRGSADAASSLDAAVDALGRGECVTVFPEGTISLDLDPMAGKSGTARLAQASGVPVTPVGLWGAHRIMFKGRKPSWHTGVAETVVVGEPVPVAADEDVRVATDRIMTAISATVARAREIYPQTPAPGEDDWWVRPPETARLRSCIVAGEHAAPNENASEAT
jgi:1-acyl-sn-glycerol-3-phosphate acyltransferase